MPIPVSVILRFLFRLNKQLDLRKLRQKWPIVWCSIEDKILSCHPNKPEKKGVNKGKGGFSLGGREGAPVFFIPEEAVALFVH